MGIGIGSVKRPSVLLIKDGINIGAPLASHLVSIEYIDAIDNEMDGLTMVFSKMFLPPKAGDKLKVSIGFGIQLEYIGEFYVSGWKEQPKVGTMEVRLTPVDFSESLKERRTGSYDKVMLDQILKTIAKRHTLKVNNELKKVSYVHKAQTNESDLVFMHRLAHENNATFSIKNGTIIFKPKSLNKENKKLPKISLSIEEMEDVEIEYMSKTIYFSGEMKFHKTKKNKTIIVKVGDEEPRLVLEGSFKDEAEAIARLVAEMERENSGTVRGRCTVTTQNVIAGAMLTLLLGYKIESDLQVTEVRHSIGYSGYTKDIKFTK